MPQQKQNLFDSIACENSLKELGIERVQILRAIESIKAVGTELSPGNIALELGVPKSFIYADLEVLELVYRNSKKFLGHDKVIQDLILKLKSAKRKINKLLKSIEEKDIELEKTFNDGFAKGASLNFSAKSNSQEKELLEEIWARGVMDFDLNEELDENLIKKKYRSLVSIIHPDKTGKDTRSMFLKLQKACDLLLRELN